MAVNDPCKATSAAAVFQAAVIKPAAKPSVIADCRIMEITLRSHDASSAYGLLYAAKLS